MKRNMKQWVSGVIASPKKAAIPVLSFPCVSLMNCTVNQLTHSSALQAEGMLRVAERCPTGAAVSFMDLSVEAEAFGATVRNSADEVPTVPAPLLEGVEDVENLAVPPVGAGRTGLYVDAIAQVSQKLTDRPVFAGCIGPYSLAGRLMGMTELMVNCFEEEDAVHALMEKCASFITAYVEAFKAAGANGVVIAEPAAGLISPAQMAEFSGAYVKRIIRQAQDDEFMVIYHNCGNTVSRMCGELTDLGAMGYHVGNAVNMADMLRGLPGDALVMGNVDPAGTLRSGSPEKVRRETLAVMEACGDHPNFVISSGCDVPPATPWENLDAFFAAAEEFYQK